MYFQYIKWWLDKEFNKDKINKKPDIFLRFITLGLDLSITSKNKIYGSRSENM